MKKIILVLALSSLFSCTAEKLDMNAARKTAETAIQLIGEEKFDEVAKLCVPDFNEGESKEVRQQKYSQIINVIGKANEFAIIDSTRIFTDEINRIVLKYSVKHEKATTTESYIVVKEEGEYLLADIYITNQ